MAGCRCVARGANFQEVQQRRPITGVKAIARPTSSCQALAVSVYSCGCNLQTVMHAAVGAGEGGQTMGVQLHSCGVSCR